MDYMRFLTSRELKQYCKQNNLKINSKNIDGKMRDNGKVFDIYKLSNNKVYYIRCGW